MVSSEIYMQPKDNRRTGKKGEGREAQMSKFHVPKIGYGHLESFH